MKDVRTFAVADLDSWFTDKTSVLPQTIKLGTKTESGELEGQQRQGTERT